MSWFKADFLHHLFEIYLVTLSKAGSIIARIQATQCATDLKQQQYTESLLLGAREKPCVLLSTALPIFWVLWVSC